MHKAWSGIEEVPYYFSISSIKFQKRTRQKNLWLGSDLSCSVLQLQFEFVGGYEMTHVAFRSMVKVPYCFSESYVKFQHHRGWKINVDVIWDHIVVCSNLIPQTCLFMVTDNYHSINFLQLSSFDHDAHREHKEWNPTFDNSICLILHDYMTCHAFSQSAYDKITPFPKTSIF